MTDSLRSLTKFQKDQSRVLDEQTRLLQRKGTVEHESQSVITIKTFRTFLKRLQVIIQYSWKDRGYPANGNIRIIKNT